MFLILSNVFLIDEVFAIRGGASVKLRINAGIPPIRAMLA